MTIGQTGGRTELIVTDMNGVPRGKVVTGTLATGAVHLPAAVFFQTITGDYADAMDVYDPADEDVLLDPVETTRVAAPGPAGGEQIICRTLTTSGEPSPFDPRNVLANVLAAYADEGLHPVVAPEVEFYLIEPVTDPAAPVRPARGADGRRENGSEAFGMDNLAAFDTVLSDIRATCADLGIAVSALVHEMGPAQFEVNLGHGPAGERADTLVLVKRVVKACAARAGLSASFMARPMAGQPGSGLHLHQSVVDDAGNNVFALADGLANDRLRHFIGGLQQRLPEVFALIAPNVNSYKRFVKHLSAPINLAWGYDNRTTGLRVPFDDSRNARVENRVAGADANPYLMVAASLACGLAGLLEQREPDAPAAGDAYDMHATFPLALEPALAALEASTMADLLGKPFVDVFCSVKRSELHAFHREITPWEREYFNRDL